MQTQTHAPGNSFLKATPCDQRSRFPNPVFSSPTIQYYFKVEMYQSSLGCSRSIFKDQKKRKHPDKWTTGFIICPVVNLSHSCRSSVSSHRYVVVLLLSVPCCCFLSFAHPLEVIFVCFSTPSTNTKTRRARKLAVETVVQRAASQLLRFVFFLRRSTFSSFSFSLELALLLRRLTASLASVVCMSLHPQPQKQLVRLLCVCCAFTFLKTFLAKNVQLQTVLQAFRLTPIHWDTALCIFSGGCAS